MSEQPAEGSTGKKTIPEISSETRLLVAKLESIVLGPARNTAEYQVLSSACGRDVQREGRHNLRSAVAIVERDRECALECVHGVGIRRMNDEDVPALGEHARKGIHRKARKAVRRMARATRNAELSSDAQAKLVAEMSVSGAIALFTRPRRFKRVEQAATGHVIPMTFDQTVAALQRRKV